jgi:SSS family solute:Na+ symporter
LKPLASIAYGGANHTFYVGLGALLLNVAVAAVVTLVMSWISPDAKRSLMVGS